MKLRNKLYFISISGIFISIVIIVNILLISKTLNNYQNNAILFKDISAIGSSSYKNRDIFDFGGRFSDSMIEFSQDLLNIESGFIDNYIGNIPNPADYEIKDKNGNEIKMQTRSLIDVGVIISISILVLSTMIEGLLILLSNSEDRMHLIFEIIKNIFIGTVLIISIPYLIKFSIDVVNGLNQTIINNYLVGFSISDKNLSEAIITSMGINSLDPNPNFIVYIGLSLVLLLNCFVIGVNYFLLIFLSVVSPLVFGFLPLHSARKYILDWANKFIQCLIIWPAWIIGIAVLVQIIHSNNTVTASTILGLIGIFGLTAIPSISGGIIGSVSTMIGTGAFSFATRSLSNPTHIDKQAGKDKEKDSSNNHSDYKKDQSFNDWDSFNVHARHHKESEGHGIDHPKYEEHKKHEDSVTAEQIHKFDKDKSDLRNELITTFRYPLPSTSPQQLPETNKKKKRFKRKNNE